MKNNLNYYDIAEDNFKFLIHSFNLDLCYNVMCFQTHETIKKFIKYIIIRYCKNNFPWSMICSDTFEIEDLANYANDNIYDFNIYVEKISCCDKYKYINEPNNNSRFVTKDDIKICKNALIYCKNYVDKYIKNH